MSNSTNSQFPSGRSITNCRKDAKRLAKTRNISLAEAQDLIAIENGALSWSKWISHCNKNQKMVVQNFDGGEPIMTKDDILQILDAYPQLSRHGIAGIYTPFIPRDKAEEEFVNSRKELVNAVDECNKACRYLQYVGKRKTINKSLGTSYGLKHRVEHYNDAFLAAHPTQDGHAYVANGSFICAAIFLGFEFEQCRAGSPNAYFNMSSKSVMFEWEKLKNASVYHTATRLKFEEIKKTLRLC